MVNQDYGACYKVGIKDLARTWSDARLACQSYLADLVSIEDAGEKIIFERLVKGSVTGSFWIGGYKRTPDNLWVWADTNKKIQSYQV